MESRRPNGTDLVGFSEFSKEFEVQFPGKPPQWATEEEKKTVTQAITKSADVEQVIAHAPGAVLSLAGRRYVVQQNGEWRRID